MLKESKLLAALELKNIFGLNTLRHTKDKKEKRRAMLLGGVWILLILMIAAYVGGLVFGLHYLGMGHIAPMYLATICAAVVFAFGIFKAGAVIFDRKGYDILCSLPLRSGAVVAARFIRMYVEDLLVLLVVMLPGGVVYAVLSRPGWVFYPMWVLCTLLTPMIPLSAAAIIGTVISAFSSRMKHKTIVESALTILVAVLIIAGSTSLGVASEEFTPEMLAGLAEQLTDLLGSIYPPAVWFGRAMAEGSMVGLLLGAAVSASFFAAVVLVAARNFHSILRRMSATSARHDYRMERLRSGSVLGALFRREFKRYLASGVYVTNTIMGPVMGIVTSAVVLFGGMEALETGMGVEINMVPLFPFILGGIFAMMPTTATAISMEGRTWWIAKSLPIPTKTILTSKLLVHLALFLPCLAVSEIMAIIALRPQGLDLLWLVLVPVVITVFSGVFALYANLLLPRFDWDSEVYVVKQSAAAGLGGLGGMLIVIVSAVAVMLLPAAYRNVGFLSVTVLASAGAAALYHKSCRVDLSAL